MFMLLWVPEPVCQIDRGNSWGCLPAITSSAAAMMAAAFFSSSLPKPWLTLAQARLTAANATTSSAGMRSVEIWKWCNERCVCAPHNLSSGTSIRPKVSRSIRCFMMLFSARNMVRQNRYIPYGSGARPQAGLSDMRQLRTHLLSALGRALSKCVLGLFAGRSVRQQTGVDHLQVVVFGEVEYEVIRQRVET